MLKNLTPLVLLAVSLIVVSCNETEKSKITDSDLQYIEAEKARVLVLPKLSLDKKEHDFGTIQEGTVATTEFIITNTGESDLVIANATATCGCTVPEWPKQPIAPGSSAPIKVSFDSNGKPGQQSKMVTLITNTETGTETFSIKANVTPKNK